MSLLNNPSVNTCHVSGDKSNEIDKIDQGTIAKYVEVFGEKNRKKIIDLLNKYSDKLDTDPSTYIQPKIDKLIKTKLSVSQILDICTSNIRVLSSREDKYWRKVNILIEYNIPSNLLYDMLLINPTKKELKETIKGLISIGDGSH